MPEGSPDGSFVNGARYDPQPMNTREYVCKIIVEVFGHTKSKVGVTLLPRDGAGVTCWPCVSVAHVSVAHVSVAHVSVAHAVRWRRRTIS